MLQDVPGFYVNRCLGPYSDEVRGNALQRGAVLMNTQGLALLLDGADINTVDKVRSCTPPAAIHALPGNAHVRLPRGPAVPGRRGWH